MSSSRQLIALPSLPKFGYINLQVRNLPSGVDADIDIAGPDGYFHLSTKQELTVRFTGLPDGASPNVSIVGPDGYSAQMVSDTTLRGLADGGPFNITGIARIFSGGPAPFCNDEADADGNNTFNIADVTYGIARIFSGGPAPICGTTGT